jgi:hypothetical protein
MIVAAAAAALIALAPAVPATTATPPAPLTTALADPGASSRATTPAATLAGRTIHRSGAEGVWDTWGQETYRLERGETYQFRVTYDQIPVRSWRLVVDGDHIQSDLHILRLKDGSQLYVKRNESHHDVTIPWGKGEEISVALSPGRTGTGVFTVTFLGPPRGQAPASYSYKVNRALEAWSVGKRQDAEKLCQDALSEDPNDGVAAVLLAGFLRDQSAWDQASGLTARALATDLPPEMRRLAVALRNEIERARSPLPAAVATQIEALDAQLASGNAADALADCDRLLGDGGDLPEEARGAVLQRRGEALQRLGRPFEAVDALTLALSHARSPGDQAAVYLRMGRLMEAMSNPAQARDAYKVARRLGLPPELDAEAAASLAKLEDVSREGGGGGGQ